MRAAVFAIAILMGGTAAVAQTTDTNHRADPDRLDHDGGDSRARPAAWSSSRATPLPSATPAASP